MTLLEAAEAFFKKEQWAYDKAKDSAVLRLGFDGKNGRWRCFLEVKEAVSHLVFFSLLEPEVPVAKRAEIAELFQRINCRLNVGNFELNLDDGIGRFRSGVDVEGVTDVQQVVRNLALLNVATMDKYLPAMDAVMRGETPLRALGAA